MTSHLDQQKSVPLQWKTCSLARRDNARSHHPRAQMYFNPPPCKTTASPHFRLESSPARASSVYVMASPSHQWNLRLLGLMWGDNARSHKNLHQQVRTLFRSHAYETLMVWTELKQHFWVTCVVRLGCTIKSRESTVRSNSTVEVDGIPSPRLGWAIKSTAVPLAAAKL